MFVICALIAFVLSGTSALASEDTLTGLELAPLDHAGRVYPKTYWDWLHDLEDYRAKALRDAAFDPKIYSEKTTSWSDHSFRQYFLFMYDTRFLRDGIYHTRDFLLELKRKFGHIDSILLWQAYPQLGFDTRTQFDFYRDLPGGLAGFKRDVIDVFHAAGVRVFLDFNPWEKGASARELLSVVDRLGADGVMLDTLNGVPDSLKGSAPAADPSQDSLDKELEGLERARRSIVFSPEDRPPLEELRYTRQSWAQWADIESDAPTIYRLSWLVPQHRLFATRRWDTDRTRDIVYSFFNGSGLLIWDNVFGTWNPYSAANRELIAATAVILNAYSEFFVNGTRLPLIPTGVKGLDANRWDLKDGRRLWLFRNRTVQDLDFEVPVLETVRPEGTATSENTTEDTTTDYRGYFTLLGATAGPAATEIRVAAGSTNALVFDDAANARNILHQIRTARAQAGTLDPEYEQVSPKPRQLAPHSTDIAMVSDGAAPAGVSIEPSIEQKVDPKAESEATKLPAFIAIPGGSKSFVIEHQKRETGCYSLGSTDLARWGWPFEANIRHEIPSAIAAFHMRRTSVTNAEYLAFVHASGYVPTDSNNFLKQIPRRGDNSLPWPAELDTHLARLPVTYVSLKDARAFARFYGERLPRELEWQWAAEGAGAELIWPWGNSGEKDPEKVNLTGKLLVADSLEKGKSPQGLLQMSGNAWELTESEWTDGHTRFVMLRGGCYLPPDESDWVIPRGPRPNQFHAKYLLSSDAIERSPSISFRTVR